jgi:hypothetical protein
VRISAAQTSAISDRLVSLVSSIPSIFARKPRPLSDVDRWKATEFRQFLLYTGPVVLRGILRDDLFQHFLSFSVAISILVNPNSVEQFDYAKGLLKYFVSRGKDLYGGEFCVYNVHSMLHITDEAQKYGSLDECSAFPFENFLFQLKKLVRSGRNPMAQIVNRLNCITTNRRYCSRDFIRPSIPDNAFIVDNHCCQVIRDCGGDMFVCRIVSNESALFDHPCDSRIVGKYIARSNSFLTKRVSASSLKQRAIMIKQGNQIIFLAILHSLY